MLVEAQVIEAKCVSKRAFDAESKDARHQVKNGLDRIGKAFSPTQEYLDGLYWDDQFYRAVVGNLILDEEQYTIWENFEQDFRNRNYAFSIIGHSRVYCYEGELSDEGAYPLTNPNGTTEMFVHRAGRRRLLAVLADLLRSEEDSEALMAMYTLPVAEIQQAHDVVKAAIGSAPDAPMPAVKTDPVQLVQRQRWHRLR